MVITPRKIQPHLQAVRPGQRMIRFMRLTGLWYDRSPMATMQTRTEVKTGTVVGSEGVPDHQTDNRVRVEAYAVPRTPVIPFTHCDWHRAPIANLIILAVVVLRSKNFSQSLQKPRGFNRQVSPQSLFPRSSKLRRKHKKGEGIREFCR